MYVQPTLRAALLGASISLYVCGALSQSSGSLTPGLYTFQSVGRTCRPYASVNGNCDDHLIDTWFTQDGSGRQIFNVQQPQSGINSYTITVTNGRNNCGPGLFSMQACGGIDYPDLYSVDDGSGRQRFAFQAVSGAQGQYNIVALGRPGGCGTYLSAPSCSSQDLILRFASGDDGSGNQRWIAVPQGSSAPNAPSPPAAVPPPLPSGTYTISSVGKSCRPFASVNGDCSDTLIDTWFSNDGSGRQVFNLNLLTPGNNSYEITTTNGRSGCTTPYWGMSQCGGSANPYLVFLDVGDLQHWKIVPVAGQSSQYNIIGLGRGGCANFLGLQNCASQDLLTSFFSTDDGSGLQRWTIQAAAVPSPSPTPPATPVPRGPPLATGTYQILMPARKGCEQYLTTPNCGQDGPTVYLQSTPTNQSRWKVTQDGGNGYVITTANPNRLCPDAHGPQGVILSGPGGQPNPSCSQGNYVLLYPYDDTTGAQKWNLTAAAGNVGTFDVQNYGRNKPGSTCANYLSVQACGGNTFPDLYFQDDYSGRQQWSFMPDNS